eukprot:429072-Hanusia_phi.AAC.1
MIDARRPSRSAAGQPGPRDSLTGPGAGSMAFTVRFQSSDRRDESASLRQAGLQMYAGTTVRYGPTVRYSSLLNRRA